MGFGIGQAVKEMRDGQKVCRAGWNGKNMWLALQNPDANSKMTEPYVYMRTAQDGLIPWLCSQADLLAIDWMTASEDEAAPTPNTTGAPPSPPSP